MGCQKGAIVIITIKRICYQGLVEGDIDPCSSSYVSVIYINFYINFIVGATASRCVSLVHACDFVCHVGLLN